MSNINCKLKTIFKVVNDLDWDVECTITFIDSKTLHTNLIINSADNNSDKYSIIKKIWLDLNKIIIEISKIIKNKDFYNKLYISNIDTHDWNFDNFDNLNSLCLINCNMKNFPVLNDNINYISLQNIFKNNKNKVVLSEQKVKDIFKKYKNLTCFDFNWLYSENLNDIEYSNIKYLIENERIYAYKHNIVDYPVSSQIDLFEMKINHRVNNDKKFLKIIYG